MSKVQRSSMRLLLQVAGKPRAERGGKIYLLVCVSLAPAKTLRKHWRVPDTSCPHDERQRGVRPPGDERAADFLAPPFFLSWGWRRS
ncbi:hypothetical protein AGR5A_pa30041 [Agrobacterium genomosp. 5 str. CFBP 6626]|nr:hypothetical protein AGR5A_pa30041 [Agrobacterium genomosp. 5 str. CFBP 6626]